MRLILAGFLGSLAAAALFAVVLKQARTGVTREPVPIHTEPADSAPRDPGSAEVSSQMTNGIATKPRVHNGNPPALGPKSLGEKSPSPGIDAAPLLEIIRGSASIQDKIAALHRACASKDGVVLEPFSVVLRDSQANDELRVMAVFLLSRRAAADRKVRDVLANCAEGEPADAVRSKALEAVCRWGGEDELPACSRVLFGARNEEEAASSFRALAENGAPAAKTLLWNISATHPDERLRHRAREAASGEYCAEHSPPAAQSGNE